MARISLREYIHEIESLIDRGDTQKAIAHCKHILRYFPKHIDTYRLFGKALLEVQKYGDASDIFQRVLSSVPDDFISQIGMSIIREDENNLDAAIWHLERAFEIQPSNKAVQDELKRLYSNRDGVTPTKIRLTRGALVRMYARGELYPQAIAEIKAAILEDQSRVDLEVILARLYFLLDQKIESTETCSSLISKLPYCYEANRILAALLPGTKRAEDAKIFEQRVIDLDPYFAFVSENTPNPIDIPDNKVMMEYLDWEPGMEESDKEQPDWAKSIGINWETDSKSESAQIDSWLDSESKLLPEENATNLQDSIFTDEKIINNPPIENNDQTLQINKAATPVDSTIINEITNEEELPKWMMEAGWQPSKEVNEEAQKGFNIDEFDKPSENQDESEEIVQGTIPDWIQKLAPVEIIDKEDEEKGTIFSVKDDNFESIFSFEKNEAIIEEKLELEQISEDDSMKEITSQEIIEETEIIQEHDRKIDHAEEFISISFDDNEFPETVEAETEKFYVEDFENKPELLFPENVQPDLKNLESSPDSSIQRKEYIDETLFVIPSDEITIEENKTNIKISQDEPINDMSWLHDLIEEEDKPEIITTDELLSTENTEESTEQLENAIGFRNDTEKDFTWLNALQAGVDSAEIFENETEESVLQPTPKSVDDIFSASSEDEVEEMVEKDSTESDFKLQDSEVSNEIPEFIFDSNDLPDELKGEEFLSENREPLWEDSIPLETKKLDESITFINETSDIPDELIHPETSEIKIETEELPYHPSEEGQDITKISLEERTPDWVESLIKEIPDISETEPISKEEITQEETHESEEGTEIGAALAWMESLAAKHGADDLTLYSKPEEREEEPPDWIKAFQDGIEKDIDQEPVSESSLSENLLSDLDMTPSWLQELHLETTGNDELPDEMIEDLKEFFESSDAVEFSEENQVVSSEIRLNDEYTNEEAFDMTKSMEEKPIKDDNIVQEQFENQLYKSELIEKYSDDQEIEAPTEIIETIESIDFESIPSKDFEVIKSDEEYEISLDEKIAQEEKIYEQLDQDNISNKIIEEVTVEFPVFSDDLSDAKMALSKGNIEDAVSMFSEHIKLSKSLDEIIFELKNSLDHYYPIDVSLWQTLGDAYFKKNQLKDALAAYSKAEELLT